MLPGSSVPQDLGSISHKDTETKESKKIESVETTASIVTELFKLKKKFYLMRSRQQYEFATSLKVGDYPTAEELSENLFYLIQNTS